MDEYIDSTSKELKKKQLESLNKTAEENRKSYDTAQQTSDTAFAEIMRQMYNDNNRRKTETNAVLEANRLNTDEGSQAALSQGNTVRDNEYNIRIAQEAARRDIDTSRQAMEDNAKAAVQQAIANADYNTANQLYTNFKTERNAAQKQVDKLLAAGYMADEDTIVKSGYSLDYAKGLYQKAQQEKAAANASSSANATTGKVNKIATVIADNAKKLYQKAQEETAKAKSTGKSANTNSKTTGIASAVTKAIESATSKATETATKKKGNTATLVLDNMLKQKSIDERQNYALAAYQSGAVDAQQCGQLLLLGSQAPTWSKPKITSLQLDAIDGDEAVDTKTAAKLKTSLFGNTPLALPKTVGEAQTMVANYVLDKTTNRVSAARALTKTVEEVSEVAKAIKNAFSPSQSDEPDTRNASANLQAQLDSGEITQNDIIARQLAADQYKQDHFLSSTDATVAEDLFMAGYTEAEIDEYFSTRTKEQAENDNEYAISLITPQEHIVNSFQQQYDRNYYDAIRTDFDNAAVEAIAEFEMGVWYRGRSLANNALGNIARSSVEFDESDLDATFRVDWSGGTPNKTAEANEYYAKADEYALQSASYLNALKEDAGAVGSFLVDAGVVLTDVATDTLANLLVPGSGLALMGMRSYEQGTMTARQAGLERGDQFLYGVTTAAIEVGTEKIFGGLKLAYGTGIADKTVGKLVDRLKRTAVGQGIKRVSSSGLGKIASAALGEGIEEVLADFAQPAADVAFGLTDEYELNFEDILYDGLLGTFVGLFGGSANLITERRQTKAAEAAYNAAITYGAERFADITVKQQRDAATWQALRRGDAEAAIADFEFATELFTNARQSATAAMRQALSDLDNTGKVNTDEATVTAVANNALNNQQSNIDNTVNNPYNENMNGGAANDGNRMDSGMADGVSGRQDISGERQTRRSGRAADDGRGHQEFSREYLNRVKTALQASGVVATELQNFDADSAAFSNALRAARDADAKNGWAVTLQLREALQGKRLYMDADGTIGFALTEDGDIEAVFKNSKTNHTKHAMDGVMPQVIALGGAKLDCYGKGLVNVYERYGFIPVCRVVFNEEYANDGWDESKGKPYIYFLIHNGDSAETVAANVGKYAHMSLEDLEQLPTFGKNDYDKAYAYRDSLLNQRQAEAENSLPNVNSNQQNGGDGLGAADAGFARQSPEIESWYAEAEDRGSDGFHDISDTQARLYTERTGFATNEVPKYDAYGNHLSRVASNALNSSVTPEAMHNSLLEAGRTGKLSYLEVTDDDATRAARAQIEYEGWNDALSAFKLDVKHGKVGKTLVAKGMLLYNNAVTAGNYLEGIDILTYIQRAATSAAQTVQAMKILAKLSPDCQLYGAVKGIDNIIADVKRIYGIETDIKINDDLLEDYHKALKSEDEEQIKAAWGKVTKSIADQIPSNWRDKLAAIRYLSMLGNPRTHIRNIVGNVGFVIPRVTSNIIATSIEMAASKISGGKFERTKAFLNAASANDRALMAVAWRDFSLARDKIMRNSKYKNEALSDIAAQRKTFKGWDTKNGKHIANPIEKLGEWNSDLLDLEDVWFSQPAYTAALAGYLKANGISAQEYTNGLGTDERMTKAQEYAIKEAQKATYRDSNAFSDAISNLRVRPVSKDANLGAKVVNAAGAVIVESTLPYKRTPANIAVRAYEYSPVGLLETISVGTYQLKTGKISGADFIARLSQGLTGTGLVALGVWLAIEGLLTGNNDDDEQGKLDGKQAYSITVGGDINITLDWLAPEVMPIMVGVELYNEWAKQQESGNGSIWGYLESLSNLAEPITEMSMLQGVQDMVDSLAESDNIISGFAIQAAAGYLSQFMPTLGGQIERSFLEDKRQSTFIDRNSDVPTDIQYILGKAFNKNPFAEYQQIDYYDAWGRSQETGNIFERIANNFLNPAYVNEVVVEDVEEELARLNELGESGMFPKKPSQSDQINGEYLTADEYEKFSQEAGQLKLKTVGEVQSNKEYKTLEDVDKAEVTRDAYNYATAIARREVKSDYEVPSWVEHAEEFGDVSTYIIARQGVNNLDNKRKGTVCEYIDSLRISKSQKSKLYEIMFPNYKNDYSWK